MSNRWNVTINGKWRAAFEPEQHAIVWARQFNLQEVVIAKETTQQAQPLTDVDLRQIIQCIDDGEPIDSDDTRKLAQMLRDRMAQQAQRIMS